MVVMIFSVVFIALFLLLFYINRFVKVVKRKQDPEKALVDHLIEILPFLY